MEHLDGAALQALLEEGASNAQLEVLEHVVDSCHVTAERMSGALDCACAAPKLVEARRLVDMLTDADAKAAMAAIEAGDDPLGAAPGARTATFMTAAQEQQEAQRAALRHKAEVAAERLEVAIARCEDVARRYRQVVLYCLHRGGGRLGGGPRALATAAGMGNVELVELLLAPGVCSQATDGASCGHALSIASRHGQVSCLMAVLNACRTGAGAGVDGSEALCVAASGGHLEAVRAILKAQLLDLDLNRAVLAACEADSDEGRRCVGALTDAGADASYLKLVERLETERQQAIRFQAKRARQREERAEVERLRAIEIEKEEAVKAERRRLQREAEAEARHVAAEHTAKLAAHKAKLLEATPQTMAQLAATAEAYRDNAGARAKEEARLRLRDAMSFSVDESLSRLTSGQEAERFARQRQDDDAVAAGALLPTYERGLYVLPVRHLGASEQERAAFVGGFAEQRVTERQQDEWKIKARQQRRAIQMTGAALVSPTKPRHFEREYGLPVSPVKVPRR